MNQTEAFLILGIDMTKDERMVKNAYREKLAVTNPEDDPEGFKRLRRAYEEACRYAKETEDAQEEEEVRDATPSGLWLERAEAVYRNIRTRQNVEAWTELFREDIFLSLEEEENCRLKLLAFLANHYKLPTDVWKLLDKKLNIVRDAKALREKFPANFVHFIVGRCERGEELEFGQFEGAEDADYDLFLEYYDHCWQALQDRKLEEAQLCLKNADGMGIRHPVMEVSRANLLIRQGHVEEAVALLEGQLEKHPGDAMISYNFAEMLWAMGGGSAFDSAEQNSYWSDIPAGIEDGGRYRRRAAEIYEKLREENESHYMANVRLTEWYCEQKRFREAKKCAEKVLAFGGDDAFMDLLTEINAEIEKGLEADVRKDSGWESALELCWCYLQDGKTARGIRLALTLEKILPSEREAEYNGLLSKLYVEQAEYEDAIAMTQRWENSLKVKMEKRQEADEKEEKKDRDRLRQVHLIRMQCYHNMGFRDRENFALAIKESEDVLTGGMKDIGILLEIAQVYLEMEEYEQCLEVAQRLVDEFQIFTAYTISLEAYRRQLDAAGVVRTASQSIHYFPTFVKSYEYLAKVYLDLDRKEDFGKVMADAEKNGVRSVILDAYKYQMDNEPLEISVLNEKLKNFRSNFLRFVEEGRQGFYEKGLPVLTEYLYSYPDDFMFVERAIFHRSAHRLEEAKADFEKALYINPSNPYALNGLSFVYKYCGEYEKALFFIKRAILYMDKEMSPVIYADMGNLYALLGDSGRAAAAYRQYRDSAGEITSKWYFDNLAEYTMREGQVQEAAAIYKNYYKKNKYVRYEKLVQLYCAAGMEAEARRALKQWKRDMRWVHVRNSWNAAFRSVNALTKPKQEVLSYPAYYRGKGWLELIYGNKGAAMMAFSAMFWNGLVENSMEGMTADAVFACILCGYDRRGKKYAEKLRDWLLREKASEGSRYYNRQKGHLQLEFLAAYYTETPEKLQEILDRETLSEICHFCTCPLCKELEGMRILLLLRMGRLEEAKERLRRNLEIQPWDEYMLAIRHTAFAGTL